MQSQVRFNRFRKKVRVRFNRVPKKVPGGFGAEPGQVQQGSGERSGEGVGGFGAEPGQVPEKVKEGSRKPWWSGSTGSGEGCREGPGEGFGNLWHRARSGSTGSTGFPALGFAARFRKICKNEICGCWGYHRSLFVSFFYRTPGFVS